MNKLEIGLGIALILFIIIAGVALNAYHQDEVKLCKLYAIAQSSQELAMLQNKLIQIYGGKSIDISELKLEDLERKCK